MHAGTEYDTEPNSDQVTAARTLLASPDIDLVYGHHAHVVQPLQKINGKWVIFGLGNNIAAQETPVEGTHRGLLVRVTFSQDSTGRWTTSDIAWVPSLQEADPPHRWCSLTAGGTCVSPDVDAAALAATSEAVNLYGADTDGAHPTGKALSRRAYRLRPELPTAPSVRPWEPRPSGLGGWNRGTVPQPERNQDTSAARSWPSPR